ncbi:MAG: hypothetical protein K2G99_05345, partial [Desulfovibrio sp.]|nr:hypothetical protein [Desulfovibrio sp.]
AELAKVNAIVAANKSDQQAAIEAARLWSEKAPDMPVEYDEEGNPRYSARHWAEHAQKVAIEPPTAERRGGIRVGEGLTLQTGENGETDVLAADTAHLGGRLLANDEVWITASGSYTAPCTGVYQVLLVGGGNGGEGYYNNKIALGGASGEYLSKLVWLTAGQQVPVTIGAGGIGVSRADKTGAPATVIGGSTVFGSVATRTCSNQNYPGAPAPNSFPPTWLYWSGTNFGYLFGSGLGAYVQTSGHYGCGGGADQRTGYNGSQGAIRLRFHNPAKVPQVAAASAASLASTVARRALRRGAQPVDEGEAAPDAAAAAVLV